MSKELNCMNCCIGDFKHSLCDCDNGMCKEYKKVGRAEDFENEVMNRTNPKTGHWMCTDDGWEYGKCSECGCNAGEPYDFVRSKYNFCPNCGADMRKGGAE